MGAVWICSLAVAFILGVLFGVIVGIGKFGEKPPVGTLKIRYDEPESDPYIFLELWEGTGDVTKMGTVNLVVAVSENARK